MLSTVDTIGVTVRYQPSMPPVTGVAGTGTFEGKRWQIHAARGVVGKLALVRGSVAIPGAPPDASLADVEMLAAIAETRRVGYVDRGDGERRAGRRAKRH